MNNCGGSGPHTPGEVRVLPLNGGANQIFCRACFDREMAWRRAENKRGVANPWSLPAWDTLAVYEP